MNCFSPNQGYLFSKLGMNLANCFRTRFGKSGAIWELSATGCWGMAALCSICCAAWHVTRKNTFSHAFSEFRLQSELNDVLRFTVRPKPASVSAVRIRRNDCSKAMRWGGDNSLNAFGRLTLDQKGHTLSTSSQCHVVDPNKSSS